MTVRYMRVRRVRNGPWVPVEVHQDGGTIVVMEGGERIGEPINPDTLDAVIADRLIAGESALRDRALAALVFGVEIDHAEYDWLVTMAAWARENAPDHPAANPGKPIDLGCVAIHHLF